MNVKFMKEIVRQVVTYRNYTNKCPAQFKVTHPHLCEIHYTGLRMELFTRGISSWTFSGGGSKGV
jgi:hypothetical protein